MKCCGTSSLLCVLSPLQMSVAFLPLLWSLVIQTHYIHNLGGPALQLLAGSPLDIALLDISQESSSVTLKGNGCLASFFYKRLEEIRVILEDPGSYVLDLMYPYTIW